MPTRVSLSYNGTAVLVDGLPQHAEPPVDGGVCTIDLDLGLGDGAAALPDERPLLRLRAHQRGVPLVSRLVVKVGGAVAAESAEARPRARRGGPRGDRRPRRRPADHDRDGARAASRSSSCGGRRAHVARGARGRARVARGRQRGALRRDRRRAPSRSSATTIGLLRRAGAAARPGRRPAPVPAAAAARRARRPGRIPVVAPLAVGPAERERRRRRGRARARRRRRRASSSSPTSRASYVDGEVVDSIDVARGRGACSTAGAFDGGIVPKLARRDARRARAASPRRSAARR